MKTPPMVQGCDSVTPILTNRSPLGALEAYEPAPRPLGVTARSPVWAAAECVSHLGG